MICNWSEGILLHDECSNQMILYTSSTQAQCETGMRKSGVGFTLSKRRIRGA